MATLAPAEETILSRVLPELIRLSPAARLEVVSQLVASIQVEANATPRKSLLDFAGAWADDPDANAMEEAIRTSHYLESKPHLENWD